MTKALNGLFLLMLIGAFGGMLLNGTSVVVSLLMTGPVAVVAFLVFSFVYFSIAVIFGKPKKLLPQNTLDVCPSPLNLGQIDLSDFGGSGGVEDGSKAVFG